MTGIITAVRSLVALVCVGLLLTTSASAKAPATPARDANLHLEPEGAPSDGSIHQVVLHLVLFERLNPELGVMMTGAALNEVGVGVVNDRGEFLAVTAKPEKVLWDQLHKALEARSLDVADQIAVLPTVDLKTSASRTLLAVSTACDLERIWEAALSEVRAPTERRFVHDGIRYHFFGRGRAGYTNSPERGSPMGELTLLAQALMVYAEAPGARLPGAEQKLKTQINTAAKALHVDITPNRFTDNEPNGGACQQLRLAFYGVKPSPP